MTDQIYPGVYISKISQDTSRGRIKTKILKYVKEGSKENCISKRGLDVKVVQNGLGNINAVVRGINLPFKDLPQLFNTRMLGKWKVNLADVDFGITREEDSGLRSHFDDQLHKHLKEGQGDFQDRIKCFTKEFVETRLGGKYQLQNKILHPHKKTDLNFDEAFQLCGFLYYENNHDTKKQLPGTLLHFDTVLDAIQGLGYLHENPDFSNGDSPVGFKFPKPSVVNPKRGLGVNGAIINVKYWMKKLRYIPFDVVEKGVLDTDKIHTTWKSRCQFCYQFYKLLGFHPDFNYFAAKCKCSFDACYTWPEEDFFRVTLGYIYNRRYENFNPTGPTLTKEHLMLLIRGLKPLYSSTNDLRISAFAAEKVEFQMQKVLLMSKFQVGVIQKETLKLQSKTKDKVPKILVNIVLDAKYTPDVWSEAESKSINTICLIPKMEVDKVSRNPTLWELISKRSEGFTGYLQSIKNLNGEDKGRCLVEVTLWVDEGFEIHEGVSHYMLPEPPTSNIDAMKRALTKWRKYIRHRDRVTEPQLVTINSVVKVEGEGTKMSSNEVGWKVTMELSKSITTDMFLKYGHDDHQIFYGIELRVNKQLSEEEQKHHPIMSQKCLIGKFANVVVKDKDDPSMTIVTAFILTPSKYVMKTGAQYYVSSWMAYYTDSTVSSEYRDSMFHLDDKDATYSSSSVLKHIIPCPLYSHVDMRDFLLDPSIPRVSHADVDEKPKSNLGHANNKTRYYDHRNFLNPSQTNAVNEFLSHRLSVMQGPPGSGKTYTGVHGVFALDNADPEDNGMILCVTQTNLASEVFINKLYEQMERTNYHMEVLRMMATTREEKQEPALIKRFVHTRIETDPEFLQNESVMKLIKLRDDKEGRMRLNEDQEKEIEKLVDRVRDKIVSKTKVLVCTIGAALDGRLENLFKKEIANLKAIIVDEGNLVTVGSILPLLGLNPRKFWILGDFKQLEPCVTSRSSLIACGDVSWMRFITHTDYVRNISPLTFLNIQYRFPESICEVVSAWHYKDELKTDPSVAERDKFSEEFYMEFPSLKKRNILRLTYNHIAPWETAKDEDSYSNEKECDIVETLVKKCIKAKIPENEITVLAMYRGQVNAIASRLKDLPGIVVTTSDSFEGKECSIVILSMTRHNEDFQIGFLRNSCRTNVGISRPKNYLMFISSEETFLNCKMNHIVKLYEIMNAKGIVPKIK